MTRPVSLAILAATAGVALITGCSDKPAPPPTIAPRPVVGASTPTQPPAPAAIPPAPVPATPPPIEGPRNDAGIEALNIAINDYYSANGTVPKDIGDLVRGRFLDKLPEPPPGKRYVIDPTRRQAKLAGK